MGREISDQVLGSEIGQRLREVRGRDTRARVQELTGLHPNTLANYEGGRLADVGFLVRFAAAYEVKLPWLLTGVGPKNEEIEVGVACAIVPVWDVEASSGYGNFVGHEEVGTTVPIPLSLVRKMSASATTICAVYNRGSSNAPDINDGDIMLVDRAADRIIDDAYYLFQEDGALLVKMIERAIGGGVILKSRNPSYEARTLTRDEAAGLSVFGRVRWRIGSI